MKEKLDKTLIIDLFYESVKSQLDLFNYMNPNFPLTMDDVLDHLKKNFKK